MSLGSRCTNMGAPGLDFETWDSMNLNPQFKQHTRALLNWLSIQPAPLYPNPQPVRLFGFPNMSTSAKTRIVGTPVYRKEGVDKLLGRARYIDDMEREGMWHGATVPSTIPRGLI